MISQASEHHAARQMGKTLHAAFFARDDCRVLGRIFDEPRRERIARFAQLLPVDLTPENFNQYRKEAAQTEVLFTSWGFPVELLTPLQFPSLRVLFYSGGATKSFARPLLERGIQVVSARAANSVGVALFCFAQIVLCGKGYFRNTRSCRRPETASPGTAFTGAGIYGKTIALLGMGTVARELISLLRQLNAHVLAVDPYLTSVEAGNLGVKIASLEEAFSEAGIVSNHLPNLPELKGVLDRRLFARMRRDATFINTGRGTQVNEADLIEIASSRPDLTALLDVTDPEPPVPGSPLYELPNIQLSSHIAGAFNDDWLVLGDCVIDELERYSAGKPLLHAEKLEMLDRMA